MQLGERDAFREVVQAMLPTVRVFVAGRSLPGIDVDDVEQRTFVEAFQSIGQFSAGTNLRAWMLAALLGRTEGAIRKQLCLLRQQLHDCVTRKLKLEGTHE